MTRAPITSVAAAAHFLDVTCVASVASVTAVAILLVLVGCEPEQAATPTADCTLGEEHPLARVRGGFDAIRIVTLGGAPTAVWSGTEGTFIRPLDDDGAPTDWARRIGPACPLGLDASADGDGAADGATIACLEPPVAPTAKDGAVRLLRLGADGSVRSRRRVAVVGVGSRGVSVAENGATRLAVAYFDGSRRGVFLGNPERDSDVPPPVRLMSREGPTAGPPDLLFDGERSFLTWAETVRDPATGTLIGEVLVSEQGGVPKQLSSILYEDAQPQLLKDAAGLVLAFRDENPAGSRVGLFLQRLSPTLEAVGEAVRVGRSDARSGVSVFPCTGGIIAVAAHSYGHREALVGVSRLNAELISSGERQIYTSGARYEHGVGSCHADAAIILVAERAPDPDEAAELKAMTLRCPG